MHEPESATQETKPGSVRSFPPGTLAAMQRIARAQPVHESLDTQRVCCPILQVWHPSMANQDSPESFK